MDVELGDVSNNINYCKMLCIVGHIGTSTLENINKHNKEKTFL